VEERGVGGERDIIMLGVASEVYRAFITVPLSKVVP
jgi:hypothetical protein